MKSSDVTTLVLLLLILVLAAYSAYASTRVVVALQQAEATANRAIGTGQGIVNLARRVFGI